MPETRWVTRRSHAAIASVALALLLLCGCATADPDAPGGNGTGLPEPSVDLDRIPAAGTVRGWATVLHAEDRPPVLCLGVVYDSFPPQCDGPEIAGWDWDAVDAEESANGVTWGAYAVTGGWDGHAFAVASAEASGLYDVTPIDPHTDPAHAGAASEGLLLRIQEQLHGDSSPLRPLGSWPENGYLFVQVIYDDGTVQNWVDAAFGPDVVVVLSALHDA
jgi:hypothetical protein